LSTALLLAAGPGSAARAAEQVPRPPSGEQALPAGDPRAEPALTAEDLELLRVLDLLEELELLRGWDPGEDLPIPSGADVPIPSPAAGGGR
jgi:hypothetical protein